MFERGCLMILMAEKTKLLYSYSYGGSMKTPETKGCDYGYIAEKKIEFDMCVATAPLNRGTRRVLLGVTIDRALGWVEHPFPVLLLRLKPEIWSGLDLGVETGIWSANFREYGFGSTVTCGEVYSHPTTPKIGTT
ncbi:unnamed protein product [Linum trigynum]|uniref:Uncharacterized protein n=1 Tax=Linum trigynum TaxID=586398 RepID=A0AAV2DCY6_9ROSI